MPTELERKLKKEAKTLGLSKAHAAAYVYGNTVMQKWLSNKHRKKLKKK